MRMLLIAVSCAICPAQRQLEIFAWSNFRREDSAIWFRNLVIALSSLKTSRRDMSVERWRKCEEDLKINVCLLEVASSLENLFSVRFVMKIENQQIASEIFHRTFSAINKDCHSQTVWNVSELFSAGKVRFSLILFSISQTRVELESNEFSKQLIVLRLERLKKLSTGFGGSLNSLRDEDAVARNRSM